MAGRSSRRSGDTAVASEGGSDRPGNDEAESLGPDPEPRGRWRLRNWSLRSKLFAILLIPTLVALVLIGMRLSSEYASAERLEQLSTRVSTEASLAGLVHELQRERDLTVAYVAGGREDDLDVLVEQRDRVDERIGGFSTEFRQARAEMHRETVAEFDEVSERLEVLTGLRYAAEHEQYPPETVLRSYSEVISSLLDVREEAVASIREPELVRFQIVGVTLARAKDTMSVERAIVAEALRQGELRQEALRELIGTQAQRDTALEDFSQYATQEQQRAYEEIVTGAVVDDANRISESVITRAESDRALDGIDAAEWDAAATETVNLAYETESELLGSMQERTDELAAQATAATLRDGAIVLGLLVLAGLLTVVIARSLLRPLRLLRSTALDVAERKLPAAVRGMRDDPGARWSTEIAPVPVYSREELGQVARAFDAVHGEAVRLAAEQAALRTNVNAMFVNLSQAGRELAERQLAVLDRMEAEETDAETLAGLFELDHLAARLRRIGENLLVLTGNDYVRMLPGTVGAAEVFGAALSQIEQYQRVQLASVPPIAIRGDSASDVVHVISELLENATNSSDPQSPVTVTSSVNHRGAWLVEITDRGPGLSRDAIERINARLSEPPEIDVEATRRMGLYVVACLAQRHGLRVWLRPARPVGLVASLLVPAELVSDLPEGAPDASSVAPLRRPDLRKTDKLRRPEAPQPEGPSTGPAPAGPPKRAPVVPDHPSGGTEPPVTHPLDEEQPTERFRAYQELLTRWFDALHTRGEAGDAAGEPARRPPGNVPGTEHQQPWQVPQADAQRPAASRPSAPEPEDGKSADVDGPTVRNITHVNAAIGVNLSNGTHDGTTEDDASGRDELTLGEDYLDLVDYEGSPALETVRGLVERDHTDGWQDPGGGSQALGETPVSRQPQAVGERMASLIDGVQRARQERGDEYAGRDGSSSG
ncbi:nitrate- and nitrite sensing domain-containing protein [Haloechinothrix sp. LS1_15]|uniref:sensor histidine kinase n=1 Tax=Haloechinothrix sp. LS1_15 TaxID=2652248 RepID=UPI00294B762A|nr:nitrate- and nitrite sensing domain-containing protein [Haloechinothrix sp. LS1_15]